MQQVTPKSVVKGAKQVISCPNYKYNISRQQNTKDNSQTTKKSAVATNGLGANLEELALNIFGTDGIRGTYGSTLCDGTAFLLGKSLALLGQDCPIIVIGRDTRNSGEKLFQSLSHGVCEGGGNVINLGILPTNAVGHFVRKFGGDYGVMITASHNPPNDNGLKVFDKYGVKLCPSKQKILSTLMEEHSATPFEKHTVFEPIFYDIQNIYADDVIRAVNVHLDGLKIALDCCYGASFRVAPLIFERCNAHVKAYCNTKQGDKINVNCGATHVEFLSSKISRGSFDISFAFDGDCDRLAVFEGDKFVSNNKVFFAMAKYFKEKNLLKGNAIAGTVLTNGGVERALSNIGITLLRSDVGDTNVFNLMAQKGLNLGGEESGHYLLTDYATTSDGIVNALFLCKIFQEKGSLIKYTQECEDICYMSKSIDICPSNQHFANNDHLKQMAQRVEDLFPKTRIVLRKSGTEHKIRAYVEGDGSFDAMQEVIATLSK